MLSNETGGLKKNADRQRAALRKMRVTESSDVVSLFIITRMKIFGRKLMKSLICDVGWAEDDLERLKLIKKVKR